jgi:hypothetical protein
VAIQSLKNSGVIGFLKYRSLLAGNNFTPVGAYDLISTTILPSSQSSVVFDVSSFASTYRHLQIRAVARTTSSGTGNDEILLRFNSDSGNSYARRQMISQNGNFSSSSASGINYIRAAEVTRNGNSSNIFGSFILDIFEPFSTEKRTVVRSFAGTAGYTGTSIGLLSGLWNNTLAINEISLQPEANSFIAGSRFSIYGVK